MVHTLALDRHAVLEASAGTGKTYTLERLVLRLLVEKNVPLEKILLVTYTEKATGELRGRLRATLERESGRVGEWESERVGEWESESAHTVSHSHSSTLAPSHILRQALDQFDQASICTIHGFCQRVLQEYAFDHGQEFRPQLVHDRTLVKTCLREIQRQHWRQEFGEELRLVLDLAGYDRTRGERWEDKVLDLAQRFRPGCGHRLVPQPRASWPGDLAALDETIRSIQERIQQALAAMPLAKWTKLYARLAKTETHRGRFRKVFLPVLEWLESAERPVAGFLKLLHRCRRHQEFAKEGFGLLRTGITPKKNLAWGPPWLEAVNLLEELRRAEDWQAWQHQLAVRTVLDLQRFLAEYKRQRGLISFEDMLSRMDEGLDPAKNPGAPHLLAILRERYHYAIVDEFQDTDPLQWRIFRRLFLDGGECRLFVVGDPKQAVFQFRGADLPTYLTAVGEMKAKHGAQELPLTTNWRSCPELLAGLNHLFLEGKWFTEPLAYQPVNPPANRDEGTRMARDTTGRAALTVVDLHDLESLTQARRHFARFCAAEIARLRDSPPEWIAKGQRKTLELSDICLLVFKRTEVPPLVDALREARLPFSFYKQTGLWQAAEAQHVEYVLQALARPEERQAQGRALLTRFFRVPPEDLARGDDLPARHPARELLNHWLALAQKQRWGPLFQSLLEDTGLLHYEALQLDGERRLANFRHIVTTLEQAAYSQNLDLFGVLDVLQAKRSEPEEDNLQPIETQRPKVKIMTIHASKGLEFPVVFLAGGFTDRPIGEHLAYRDGDQQMVFDLTPDDKAREAYKRDRDAEYRRLLYVALTRAMVKLYVPQIEGPNHQAGPLVKILTPALQQAQIENLGPPMVGLVEPPSATPMDTLVGEPSCVSSRVEVPATRPLTGLGSPMTRPPLANPKEDPEEIFPRLDPNLSQRRIVIRSFSSLHRQLALRVEEGARFVERVPRADDDAPDALEGVDALRGPVFGDMVHNILEKIDFAVVGQAANPQALAAEAGPLLDAELANNLVKIRSRASSSQLKELGRQQIADLVWKALHTPLAAAGGPLWQVPPADRIHELEFHFPEYFEEPPVEVRREEGFLTGFMDLVFRRQGRFFLADWKTNLLDDYSAEGVAQSVVECDYVRQYRLYLQALARWLRRIKGDAFDFARDFGGVYYLYLRGMNGRDESTGVYFHRPTVEDLNLRRVLAEV